MGSAGADDQLATVGRQDGAGGEPLDACGVQGDNDLATDTVGPVDPTDL